MVSVGPDIGAILRRSATLLDQAATAGRSGVDTPIPRFFGRRDAHRLVTESFTTAARDARAAARLLADAPSGNGDARTAIAELADRVDPRMVANLPEARRYSVVADVPAQLQVHAAAQRLLAEVHGQDPVHVRAALRAEVDALLARPDAAITIDDVRRMAAIQELPSHLRPELPTPLRANYPMRELAVRKMVPARDSIGRGEWERLRLDQTRRAMVADPTVTRDSLDAELRAIVATTNAQVTPDQVRRLSLIAGMPDDLRPALADTRMPWAEHRLEDLSAWNWHPASSGDARAKFDALRMAIEQEALLRDPAVTRAAVTAELQDLLAIRSDDLTIEQLHRTSVLARLPEHVRPPMPVKLDGHYRFEDLGLLRYHPRGHAVARNVFDHMRAHMAAVVDPEGAARRLRAQVDAGELIDFRIVAALDEHVGLLGRLGLTPEVLHAQAVRSLAGAGSGSREALSHHVKRVRDTLAAAELTDPGLVRLRDDALELADRNLDRMSGARADTFVRHPDYGEIGRFVAIAELLDAVRPAVRVGDDAVAW